MRPIQVLLFIIATTATNALTQYITHSFTFPHIPYHNALRHIHTPERCVEVYGILPPCFEIVKTSPPQRINTYNAVSFRFTTIMCAPKERHHAVLFSSSPDASQLLLMDTTGTPYMLVSYSVRVYLPQHTTSAPFEGGHTLMITGSHLRTPSELETLCSQRVVDRQAIQNAIQIHKDTHEDRHLRAYRHNVLRVG